MHPNLEKITPELTAQNDLVFFPRSLEEAAFIQRQLFAMGFTWGQGTYDFENGGVDVIMTDMRLLEGLQLEANRKCLFAHPSTDAMKNGLLCSVEQFDDAFLSPHQELLNEFNKLAKRLEDIEAQVNPRTLDKKSLNGQQP